MNFKNLEISNEIKHGLSDLGFREALEVQKKAFEYIMNGDDLIVASQTGSGKTAAFGIPVLEKVSMSINKTQAIVLVPTRELALQVKEEFDSISQYKEVKTIALYGKEDMHIQRKKLRVTNHVIIATPGRLMDHMLKKNIDTEFIKYLVIDEADEMLIMGFLKQIESIISFLPEKRTTLLFSATISEQTEELASKYMEEPIKIEMESDLIPVEKIQQGYFKVPGNKKVDFLNRIIKREQPRRCIVFCNTREEVIALHRFLEKKHERVYALHGGMKQEERFMANQNFKKHKYNILVTTDVSSRGIHIQGITHVINYYVPFEVEQYVHRIGRTGRVDETGIAITLASEREMERLHDIEEYIGYKIPLKGQFVDRKRKPLTADQERSREKKLERGKKKRFKDDMKNKKRALIEISIGKSNSKVRAKEIAYNIKKISGVEVTDVGKINIGGTNTRIYILNGKEDIVIKGLRNKTIKGTSFQIRKIQRK